ncbi:PSD1 and planctomycete cytochrome C domain-containing protein [Fimbriiglobus ruber]|uniref:PSD1 and planctomycete cytochrome C domain-containing protein n=1 Tax=Fimbriiglobus ruber TaxID=1908690 RepID=UPI0013796F6F|nr:PSD1 and planctomycete cytochrome C domain-containing protein [Fimbriiglobus ruber]
MLSRQCYECHSGSVQARGGLRLDTREGIQIGGQRGPALNLDKPEESQLLLALSHTQRPRMPPAGKLDDGLIADFTAWVKMGAPDPRVATARKVPGEEIDLAKARKEGWVYQPPKKPAVPDEGKDWAWSPIDQFVRAKQANGIHPVADAPPLVWLRRVTYDLVGLPPTVDQIADIEKDSSRAAREKIVDKLLASAQFGERWGRHWLDIARYAESTGKERNFIYPQAWRYRDYVIDAFSQDKPYDRFLREQIAGDLLPADSPAERDRNRIATGYLALGPKGMNDRNRESFVLDIADEQIENVGRGVLALSIGCARCHEHKFDPIRMSDYYALAGIFRSSETRAGVMNRQFQAGRADLLLPLLNVSTVVVDPKLTAEIAVAEKDVAARREALGLPNFGAVGAPTGQPGQPGRPARPTAAPTGPPGQAVRSAANGQAEVDPKRVALLDEFRKANDRLFALQTKAGRTGELTLAAGVVDRPDPHDIPIRHRGEVDQFGPIVHRGFPKVIEIANPPGIDDKESGRRQLADWLTRPDHPLTSRVIVNRIWAKLLGVGIVPTLDDFGDQGQKPTHPELLDFLAVRLIERGWSVKTAIKEIVLTRTYQLSGADDAGNLAKDEANVFLWRWNRKRLDAESLRDTTLVATGQLDLNRPVGSPVGQLGLRELGTNTDFGPIQTPSRHRSVYLPVVRHKSPEPLALFDLPDPSLVVGQRETTTSPGQALYLLNSPFSLTQARHLAKKLLDIKDADDSARVERAFLAVLARKPTSVERDRVLKFLAEWPTKSADTSEARELAAWTSFAQALLALPEFRYLF